MKNTTNSILEKVRKRNWSLHNRLMKIERNAKTREYLSKLSNVQLIRILLSPNTSKEVRNILQKVYVTRMHR